MYMYNMYCINLYNYIPTTNFYYITVIINQIMD